VRLRGAADERAVAWRIGRAGQGGGTQLAFTCASERLRGNLGELRGDVGGGGRFPIFPCDVQHDEQIDAAFAGLRAQWGALDVVVHCLAFAGREELARPFTQISRQGYAQALEKTYLPLMAAHLEQSVALATLAARKASRPEVRAMAQQIVQTESREAAMLRDWLRQWYGK